MPISFLYAYLLLVNLLQYEPTFIIFAQFQTVLLLCSISSFVHNLDRSHFSTMCFSHIFSQYVVCYLILFTVTFAEEEFYILINSDLSLLFSLMVHRFVVLCEGSSPIPKSHDIFHVIFWTFFRFVFYFQIYYPFSVNFCERCQVYVYAGLSIYTYIFHMEFKLFQHHLLK